MFDKIKNNLKEIIATVAIIGTIGGGFIKYGRSCQRLTALILLKLVRLNKT